MKKHPKRLSLTRETLSHLQRYPGEALPHVAGGRTALNCGSVFTDCPTEPTSNMGTCGSCYTCTTVQPT